MENMKEDAQFFKLLANIDDKKRKIEKSNSEPKIVGAREFWDQVEVKYIHMLAEPFAYKYDLEFFGYSVDEYAEDIGLTLSWDTPIRLQVETKYVNYKVQFLCEINIMSIKFKSIKPVYHSV